jgi:hypothetical protein
MLGIIMGNFVQAMENDVHMYAKFGGLTFYVFLWLNTPIFDLWEFDTSQ